jgi:deoxycytidylate deaminase
MEYKTIILNEAMPSIHYAEVYDRRGRFLGSGHNYWGLPHKAYRGTNHVSCHAETAALNSAHNHVRGDMSALVGATVYVVRCTASGEFRNSVPCENCANVMKRVGIKTVVSSIDDAEYSLIRY